MSSGIGESGQRDLEETLRGLAGILRGESAIAAGLLRTRTASTLSALHIHTPRSRLQLSFRLSLRLSLRHLALSLSHARLS